MMMIIIIIIDFWYTALYVFEVKYIYPISSLVCKTFSHLLQLHSHLSTSHTILMNINWLETDVSVERGEKKHKKNLLTISQGS